jgi:hypothetical protein
MDKEIIIAAGSTIDGRVSVAWSNIELRGKGGELILGNSRMAAWDQKKGLPKTAPLPLPPFGLFWSEFIEILRKERKS